MSDADIRQLLERGLEFHRSGRRAEAERQYRLVLAAAPDHPDALHLLGVAAHQDGRPADALELIDRASATEPTRAAYHNHAGLALLELGRADAAEARFRRAIRLRPELVDAYNNLGTALQRQRRPSEALASYRDALRLAPDFAPAALNLGNVLAEEGRCDEALACYLRARSLEATPQFRRAFAYALQRAQFDRANGVASDPAFTDLVVRAVAEPWARPADLSRACVRLLEARPSIGDGVARANAAWPRRLGFEELFGRVGLAALAREPLLAALLERAPVADAGLERVLTSARRVLLDEACAELGAGGRAVAATDDASIALRCALARQCFLNGYVFDAMEDESAHVSGLADAIDARLRDGAELPSEWIAAIASYVPLATIAAADRLLDRASTGSVAAPVAALLRQQLIEPRRERELREALPRLASIDPASDAVRAQYEEHPYPRWTGIARFAPDAKPGIGASDRSSTGESASGRPVGRTSAEILVAGCGTGQESIEVALEYPSARVLAVDLSLASLAYAERMAREMQVANVTHAQADILHLGDLGRTFDAIYSVGVLHHLEDPAAGLSVLASLLRPDGIMLIGLYSERARRDIVAARTYIAEAGYRPTTEDIRRCRQDLMAKNTDSPLGRVVRLRDFHATEECRDLLFHVEEHRYTFPQVQTLAEGAGLRVTEVAAPDAARREYSKRFPDDPAMTDLARWDACEADHPDTFAGMYLLWVARRSAVA